MEKVYVSLGSACHPAICFRLLGRKKESYPLDWLYSYHNVYKIFENDFFGFLNTIKHKSTLTISNRIAPDGYEMECNPNYSIIIEHKNNEADYEGTIKRRIERLLNLLESQDKEIVFVRRGHWEFFHKIIPHSPLISFDDALDEKEDMEKLVEVLKTKYPKLKFKIHLFIAHNCKNIKDSESEYLNVKFVKWSKDEVLLLEEIKKI